MNLRTTLLLNILGLALAFSISSAKTNPPEISVLPWNGAKGAYSLIMDDFCMWDRINASLKWADSVANERKLNIGFAVATASCQAGEWATAKTMLEHGNELISHSVSHTHPKDWTGMSEITNSTQTIFDHTGFRPTFFAYPFDEATDSTQAELVRQGYLGARNYVTRTYTGAGFNFAATLNGITAEYDARQPPPPDPNAQYQTYAMDAYADSAASKGAWALRETHGIEDGSWGAWSKPEFIAHLDHLVQLRDRGELWIATPSTVIRYANLSRQAQWRVTKISNTYEVQWTTPKDSLARYGTPLRILVGGKWKATLAGKNLDVKITAEGTQISVNPTWGILRLTRP
jgi:peptidoglycan/xylan/chitin deacetylase (PgdA/CDA1 family)